VRARVAAATSGVLLAALTALAWHPALAGAATSTVAIGHDSLSPTLLTITVGDTVSWSDPERRCDGLRADDGSFSSGQMDGKWSHTFTQPTTVGYRCTNRSEIRGTIIVQVPSPPAPAAATAAGSVAAQGRSALGQLAGPLSAPVAGVSVPAPANPAAPAGGSARTGPSEAAAAPPAAVAASPGVVADLASAARPVVRALGRPPVPFRLAPGLPVFGTSLASFSAPRCPVHLLLLPPAALLFAYPVGRSLGRGRTAAAIRQYVARERARRR